MICFLICRGYEFTAKPLQNDSKSPQITILTYDKALYKSALPRATYIFTDLDRLDIASLTAAARLFQRLKENGCRVLNNPARVRTRFALLHRLYKNRLNPFDAYLLEERATPERFPVFIRIAEEHSTGPLTDLIWDQQTLDHAIEAALEAGYPRRALILIEYAAQPVRPGIFRKLSVFRVADHYVPHLCVHDVNWIVKHGKPGIAPLDLYDEELEILRNNPFAEDMKAVFENAEIDYGRVDFGLVDDRPCVYEINTNPTISRPYHHPIAQRVGSMEIWWKAFLSAMAAIDEPDGAADQVDVSGDSVTALSNALKIYPLLSQGFLRLSKEHVRRGDCDAAIQCGQVGIGHTPEDVSLTTYISKIMTQKDRLPDAIDLAARAVELNPNNVKLVTWLSKLMADNNCLEKAIDFADRAVKLKPKDPELWIFKARLLRKANSAEEALEAVQRAISLRPDKGEYYQLLSQIQDLLGNLAAALEAAKSSLELSSEKNKPVAIQRVAALRTQRRRQRFGMILRQIRRALQI